MKLLAVAVAGRGVVDPGEPVFYADDEAVVRGTAAFQIPPGGAPFHPPAAVWPKAWVQRHADSTAAAAASANAARRRPARPATNACLISL